MIRLAFYQSLWAASLAARAITRELELRLRNKVTRVARKLD